MKNKLLIISCIIVLIPLIFAWAHWANDPVRVVSTNYRRAKASFKGGNYKHAIYLLQATLEQVKELAPGSPDHADVLASLCLTYFESKDYKKAKAACSEALTLAEKLYDPQSYTTVQLRAQLRKIEQEQNRTY